MPFTLPMENPFHSKPSGSRWNPIPMYGAQLYGGRFVCRDQCLRLFRIFRSGESNSLRIENSDYARGAVVQSAEPPL